MGRPQYFHAFSAHARVDEARKRSTREEASPSIGKNASPCQKLSVEIDETASGVPRCQSEANLSAHWVLPASADRAPIETYLAHESLMIVPSYIATTLQKPDPAFERLTTALKGMVPDRVPLIELMVDEEVKSALLGRPISDLRDEVAFWLAAGYDYVPLFLGPVTTRSGVAVLFPHQTFRHDLTGPSWIHSTKGGGTKKAQDLTVSEWPDVDEALFADFDRIRSYLPSDMKVIGCVSALLETLIQAMGLEALSVTLYEDPGLAEALFHKAGTFIKRSIERMLEYDCVGALWIADDLACTQGPIISPAMLRTYVFPWYKTYTRLAHEKGLPVLFHTCGNPQLLFEDIIEAGFDALHPLEPTCVDIYHAKDAIGSRICLCGNIDLCYGLIRASSDEIVQDVKEHIRRLAPGGGYCLGSSSAIPHYVSLESYLTMNSACLTYGRYPISI